MDGEFVFIVREEGRVHRSDAVGQLYFEANALTASVCNEVCSCNLSEDRDIFAFVQHRHRGQCAPVVVATRRTKKQVFNGFKPCFCEFARG